RGAQGVADGPCNGDREIHALGEGAAPTVGALIGARGEELVNGVVIGPMDFNAVEPGMPRERRRAPKTCHQASNLVARHGPWCFRTGSQRRDRGSSAHAVLAYDLWNGDAASVIDLQDREATCSTHGLSQSTQPRQVAVMHGTDAAPGSPTLF